MLDFENMCLCCMGKRNLKSLFESPKKGKNASVTYLEMFEVCCFIKIEKSDRIPRYICSRCLIELNTAYKFKKKCEHSYTELINKIHCLPCDGTEGCLIDSKNNLSESVIKLEVISNSLDSETEEKDFDIEHLRDGDSNMVDNTDSVFVYDLPQKCDDMELVNYDKIAELSASSRKEKLKTRSKRKCQRINATLVPISHEKLDLNSLSATKVKAVCSICKKKCHSVSKLRDHLSSVHLGIKPYYCSICKKQYTSEKRHKRKHAPNKAFSKNCQYCNEVFDKRSVYFQHIRQHGKHLTCECGASFRNSSSLYRHRQKHKGKQMMCHFCSKSFLRQDNLNEHIRRHNKDATHACDVCPKKFFNAYDLKMHKARHATEKNYRCDECEIPFRTKQDLYQHTWRYHSVEKRYACKFCSKAFRRSDHRNIHQRSVHSLDEKRLLNQSES